MYVCIKSSPKAVWQDLMEGDVRAWLPSWSNVTVLALGDPNKPCPLISRMLSTGRCSLQVHLQSNPNSTQTEYRGNYLIPIITLCAIKHYREQVIILHQN